MSTEHGRRAHTERMYTVIDLFAGCGGLSAGLRRSERFRPVAAVEHDLRAAATYAMNFGPEHVFAGDIADWLRGPVPRADVVVGGPPCQGFSALGKKDPNDPRNDLWQKYVEALVQAKPRAFVLENVPQFLASNEHMSLKAETDPGGRLADYELESHLVNSADYGTGQARKRVVVLGRLKGTPELGRPRPVNPSRTLKDVLSGVNPKVTTIDLPESSVSVLGTTVPGPYKTVDLHFTRQPTPRSLQRYAYIKPGENRHAIPDHLSTPGWRRHKTGSGDVMGRLVWDKPSVTIRTEFFKPEKGRYLHPDEQRPITHYEAARLQGFEDDFEWCGNKSEIARQIGNAVPVLLAEAIGLHVAQHLDVTGV
jgi:DNA (cytosine-5)-methyltransferase 1